MYSALLHTHSILRWFLLLAAIVTLFLHIKGWLTQGTYTKRDRISGGIFIGLFHLQVVLGLILYSGVSPLVRTAMKDMGSAMKDPVLRFWGVEHIVLMLIAVVVAQVSLSLSKRAEDDLIKFKRASIGFAFALIIMCLGIPWPFRASIGRALLPF